MGNHVLIKPKLDMREVAHVELVKGFVCLGRRSALEELSMVSEVEDVDDGVHVGGGGKVEPGAYVFPIVLLIGPLVLPVEILIILILPEHQVDQDLLQQG